MTSSQVSRDGWDGEYMYRDLVGRSDLEGWFVWFCGRQWLLVQILPATWASRL